MSKFRIAMSNEIISRDQAEKIARDYVCGNCWKPLYVVDGIVTCTHVNCDHKSGFVSKYYVEKTRAENRMQSQDFNRICGESIGIPKVKLTDEERVKLIETMWNY